MTSSSRSAFGAKRFVINLAVNLILYCVNLAGGIVLVPIVIHSVGLEAYGYYPLVMTFSLSMTLIIASLSQTYMNFYTIAARKNVDEAIRIFSTGNLMLLAVAAAFVPVIIAFVLSINHIIVIPYHLIGDVKVFYLLALLSTLVTMIDSGISVITFSLNRLDLKNLSQIINRLLFVGGTIVLLWLAGGRLAYIGLAMLTGAVGGLTASIIFWRTLAPEATISLARFDKAILRAVGRTSLWVLLSTIGTSFLEQADLFFINIYWGSATGGVYGAIAQAALAIRVLSWIVTQVSLPKAAHLYATTGTDELPEFTAGFQNSFAILFGFTIGTLISYSNEILTLWLGPSMAQNTLPFAVVMAFLLPNTISLPSFQLFPILNKMELPGVVTLALAALYVAALVGLGFVDARQPIFVPIIGGTILMIKNVAFIPWYCARLLNRKTPQFLVSQLIGIAVALSCFLCSRVIAMAIAPQTFLGLAANVAILGVLCLPYLLSAAQKEHRVMAVAVMRKMVSRG